MPTEISDRLFKLIFDKFDNETAVAIRNLFAAGCYIHSIGHRNEGRKICHSALYAVGYSENKQYFSDILETLDGNEQQYAKSVAPHDEVMELFLS